MAKKYKIVNDNDGNVEIELEATKFEDAITEAFDQLGWTLSVSHHCRWCGDEYKPDDSKYSELCSEGCFNNEQHCQ